MQGDNFDLDLAWDEDSPRYRHRRPTRSQERRSRSRRKSRRSKTIVALVISLVILGMFATGAWYGIDKIKALIEVPDYTTPGSGSVEVEVRQGDTSTDIGKTLEKSKVVKSAQAFTNAAKKDNRSRGISPGYYSLRLKMRATDALALMLDPASKVTNKVTIPEGMIAKDIYTLLSKKTGISVAEFESVAKNPATLGVPASWLTRDDGKQIAVGAEGFLFPWTYDIPKDSTATSILSMMVKMFFSIVQKLDFVNRIKNERHITPYEALIAASIVQAEVSLTEDMPKVARVLYNRLYGPNFPARRLETDTVVNYWLRIQGKDPKESRDLKMSEMHNPNNPYNTHDVPGFPIGPIGNPGEDALRAVMLPDSDTKILFFVTIDKQGHNAFAATYAEHQKNCEIAKKNGVL